MKEFTLFDSLANKELEYSLLASLSKKPELFHEINNIISAQAFSDDNLAIYKQICNAVTNNNPMPELDGDLLENPIATAKELEQLIQKRYLAQTLQEGLKKVLQENTNLDDCTRFLDSNLDFTRSLVKKSGNKSLITITDSLDTLIQEIHNNYEARKSDTSLILGLNTGILKLDNLLGGLQTGIHLISGEPGQGKTTFCLQAACNVSRIGYPALFVSFEEMIQKLVLNAICCRAGLEAKRFREGWSDPEILKQAINRYLPELKNLYFIEGNSKFTIHKLEAESLQIMNKTGKEKVLIVVDYLQRWAASSKEFNDYRHVISTLTSDLRELSFKLKSPLLVISSQNRSGQGEARLTSFKESGELEYSADSAMFLVKDDRSLVSPNRAVKLCLIKNRYGDKEDIRLNYAPHLGQFTEDDDYAY